MADITSSGEFVESECFGVEVPMRRKDTPSVIVMEDYMEDMQPREATVGMAQEVVGSTPVQDCPDCLEVVRE